MTQTTPSAIPEVKPHNGIRTLLIGEPGSGKTTVIKTLIDAGITPFILATEPGVNEILGDVPADKCHWHYLPPASPSWDIMLESARRINTMSLDALSKISPDKLHYTEFMQLISIMADFKCQRTGKSFGPVDHWSTDRAIVLDSLSGVNIMAMNLAVGSKPVKSQADWQIAMDNIGRFLQTLCFVPKCHVVVTAHPEREQDETTGAVRVMASTLGKRTAPTLPRFFSDVIWSYREGTTFYWSTNEALISTKTRNLPLQNKLPASFVPLIENWKKKGGIISPTLT